MKFFSKSKMVLAVILMLICNGFSAPSSDAGKILVLGFDCGPMTSLEDTLLRETLMRELISRGHQVVPVMSIEGYLQNNGSVNIRKMTRKDVERFCHDTGAAAALGGTIKADRGNRYKSSVGDGDRYDIVIRIYSKQKETPDEERFSIVVTGGLKGFFAELSRKAAGIIAAGSAAEK